MQLRTTRTVTLASLTLTAVSGAAHAATLQVPSASYPSLPIAITAAAPGDEIVLAAGNYLAVPGFVINNKRLTLRGATGNPEDVVLDGFDVTANRVLSITGAGSDGSVLDAITIAHGRGANTANDSGAGLYLNAADVTITNCIFRDNVAIGSDAQGAGLYGTGSNTIIIDSEFRNNTFLSNIGEGGAIYFNAGSHLIRNCRFTDNGLDPAVTPNADCTGGALYSDAGSMQITESTFTRSRGGRGGAIYVRGNGSEINMDACEITDNFALTGAGVYIDNIAGGTTARVRNSLFARNHTTGNDCAFFTSKPTTFTNCTFADNTADNSYVIGGVPTPGTVFLNNCIIWGNTINTHIIPPAMGAVVRFNTLQTAYAGAGGSTSNTTVDPHFVNLAAGDFRLAAISPAIDAGNSDLYTGPFADLDANNRAVDRPETVDTGSAVFGPIIDKGCYEFQVAVIGPACPGDLSGDDFVNIEDLNAVLSNWNTGCN